MLRVDTLGGEASGDGYNRGEFGGEVGRIIVYATYDADSLVRRSESIAQDDAIGDTGLLLIHVQDLCGWVDVAAAEDIWGDWAEPRV